MEVARARGLRVCAHCRSARLGAHGAAPRHRDHLPRQLLPTSARSTRSRPRATASSSAPPSASPRASTQANGQWGVTPERARAASSASSRSPSRPIGRMRKRGIRVLPGGDYGFAYTPHGTYARDLCALRRSSSASRRWRRWSRPRSWAARSWARPGELGVVKPGALADLLLVDGDPARRHRDPAGPRRAPDDHEGRRPAQGALTEADRRDPEASLRAVPPLLAQEGSAHRPASQPRDVPDPGRRPPARARGAVLQAGRLTRRGREPGAPLPLAQGPRPGGGRRHPRRRARAAPGHRRPPPQPAPLPLQPARQRADRRPLDPLARHLLAAGIDIDAPAFVEGAFQATPALVRDLPGAQPRRSPASSCSRARPPSTACGPPGSRTTWRRSTCSSATGPAWIRSPRTRPRSWARSSGATSRPPSGSCTTAPT